jgi:hypothetical protein
MSRMSRAKPCLRSGLALGALALAGAIAGCGGGGTTTAKQTAQGAVTPEAGGTVKLADDSVKLDVPPGAVPANTTIKMTTTDAAAPQGITAVSPVLQFEPDGIVFDKPITVTFTFKNATKPVVYWSNHTGGYDLIAGTISGSTISASVTHFSMGFVGEEPAGSSDKCGAGVACGTGTTCGYGGGTNGGGSGTTADASAGGDPKAGGGTNAGGGSSAGAADASGPSTNDPGAPRTSALSLDAGASSSTGMCCSCVNGSYQCSTCSAPVGGGDDAGVQLCTEGAACSQPGAGCGSTSGGSGGSTNGGGTGPIAGAADASASRAGSAGSCCMCGTDGKIHCGLTCAPISGGADGGANNADASNTGGGSGGLCEPGDPCQPNTAMCKNASPSSCSMCMCGADGKLVCMPCDGAQPPPPDGGTQQPPAQCAQGAKCQPGQGPCESALNGVCAVCRCDQSDTLSCAPCGAAADAGAPPPPPADGGATGPSSCAPGAPCAQGAICDAKTPDGACMTCKCDQNGTYQCGACGGSAPPPADGGAAPPLSSCVAGGSCAQGELCDAKTPDGGCMTCKCGADGTFQCGACGGAQPPPASDASAPPPPPQGCVQGAKCPSPGATCGGSDAQGACTQCACSVDGVLACKPCP